MNNRLKIDLIPIMVLFAVFSCDALRNNTFDPKNPNNDYRKIEGVVKTVSIPYNPPCPTAGVVPDVDG